MWVSCYRQLRLPKVGFTSLHRTPNTKGIPRPTKVTLLVESGSLEFISRSNEAASMWHAWKLISFSPRKESLGEVLILLKQSHECRLGFWLRACKRWPRTYCSHPSMRQLSVVSPMWNLSSKWKVDLSDSTCVRGPALMKRLLCSCSQHV